MLWAHPSQPVRYPWLPPIPQRSSRIPVRQNSQAPHYRQNKAERPGTRSLTHLCSGGFMPRVGMGDRVLGLCFCVLFCFTYMKLTSQTPSPPKPAVVTRHPPLIIHPLPYRAPSLTLGASSCCGEEQRGLLNTYRLPPSLSWMRALDTDQGEERGAKRPSTV